MHMLGELQTFMQLSTKLSQAGETEGLLLALKMALPLRLLALGKFYHQVKI